MTLTETAQLLGNFGEFFGAIAVVATLTYLAMQVRESKRATLADVYQTRALSRGGALLQVALNCPTFHKILCAFEANVAKVGEGPATEALTDEEHFLLRNYYHELMVRMDNVHFQYRQGFIPEDYFESVKDGLRRFAPTWEALGVDAQYPIASIELFRSYGGSNQPPSGRDGRQ